MKEIPLTRGQVALVDDADYKWLTQWKWHAHPTSGGFYAKRQGPRVDGSRELISMHAAILDAPAGREVDHKDGNGLNNQRWNLRLATPLQNRRNKKRYRNNTSGFKGVSQNKGRWVARISIEGKILSLGYFDDPADAARAYDAAAVEHFGQFARLNFPR